MSGPLAGAAPDAHLERMDPTHETPSDVAGERTREETRPEKPGPVSPAPPLHQGRDVNDVDDLESTTGRFLGEHPGQPAT